MTTPDVQEPRRPADFPTWVPPWAHAARRSVLLRHDRGVRAARQHLRPVPDGRDEAERYGVLAEFLAEQLFGRWSLVLHYDLGRGLRVVRRPRRAAAEGDGRAGQPQGRRSERALEGAGGDVRAARSLRPRTTSWPTEEDRLSLAVIIDQASYSFRRASRAALSLQTSSQLVTMLNWAMSPHVKRLNMAFVLIDEKLADLSDRLTGNPHVATIEVPLPAEEERARVHRVATADARRSPTFSDFDAAELAKLTAGISLTDLNVLVQSARESGRAARRDGVPRAQEAADRAAVPRAARVHRAEVDARHRRRPRGGEGAAARGRGAAEARRARHACRWAICSAVRSAPASRSSRSASAARSACRA